MLKRLRFPTGAFCMTILSMLAAGCGAATPELARGSPAVVATVAPAAETAASQPTPGRTSPSVPATETLAAPPPVEQPHDDREDPVRLLASYYNAVNRKEYERAYSYWENPPSPSYEEFVQGYADTASVLLVVRPPTRVEGAAGSQYASIAALLIATHIDGSQHAFVGCFVARRVNPELAGEFAEAAWSLYNATVTAAPGNSTDATLLAAACAPL